MIITKMAALLEPGDVLSTDGAIVREVESRGAGFVHVRVEIPGRIDKAELLDGHRLVPVYLPDEPDR